MSLVKKDMNSGSEDEYSTKGKRKDMTSEETNQARTAKYVHFTNCN